MTMIRRVLIILILLYRASYEVHAQISTYVEIKPSSSYSVQEVSNLESNPGATYVIFLDIYALSSGTLSDKIVPIVEGWRNTAEDYRPFNVNVTTKQSVFNPCPASNRVKYTINYSDGGGHCFMNSFGDGNLDMNQCIGGFGSASHEVGHSLGLSHSDGTIDVYVTSAGNYYKGNKYWSAIMGGARVSEYTLFSNGDYLGANNKEDQLAIIASKLQYRVDEAGDTTMSSRPLVLTDADSVSPVNNNGIISSRLDKDFYSITIPVGGGDIDLKILPMQNSNNLHIKARLLDALGNVIATGIPIFHDSRTIVKQGVLIKKSIAIGGNYYLKIENSDYRDQNNVGYSNYGSVGYYEIQGRVGFILASANFVKPEFSC